jgi:hypothetical protein
MQMIFPKAMFDLEVGWIHFHKTTPTNLKRMFGYGDWFVTLKNLLLLFEFFFCKFGYE